ncbi:hypothetical protein LXL04_014439 [Taraxacum kok-saghyz]
MSGGIPYVISLKAVSSASSFSRSSAVGGKVPSSAPRACSAGVASLAAVCTDSNSHNHETEIKTEPQVLEIWFMHMILVVVTRKSVVDAEDSEIKFESLATSLPTSYQLQVVMSLMNRQQNNEEAAFKAAWPIIKLSFLKPTRGETPVRSTQACFPPIHPKTKISAGLRVDLPSSGSVKKLTGASFLADITARLNTSKRTSLTMSCRYLKPGRSLQCTACSPNESKHALRQIGHNSSTGKSGINRRYLRMNDGNNIKN